jgi:O-antigen/teichoic acid export membrane protein
VKRWFSDGLFRAVLKNSSYLGFAKLLGAPLGLLALACAGRGLSVSEFGLLMVIHSYANGAGALAKFQTWQLIIRYGGPALARGEPDDARHAIRFAFGLDIASGLVGMAGAAALLPLLSGRLGLSGTTLTAALIYCTLVPTMTTATPAGILRLTDRFDLIGAQQLATPVLRALGASVSFFGHLGFPGFVATWYVADIVGDLVAWKFAASELRRRDMTGSLRPSLFASARRLPDAWSFAWTTNVGHSVYAAWGPLSNIVVAAILGPAAAGLYKIASTLLDSTSKPADLLSRGFYPEIMRLDPASRAPWRLAVRTGTVAGLIGLGMLLIVMIGGKPVIGAVFGAKYLAAYGLLRLMIWSLAISMASFPLESLLYMVGRQRMALVAQVAATLLYLGLLTLLTWHGGLIGAGVAFLLGSIAMTAFMLVPVTISYRRRTGGVRVAQAPVSGA